MQRDQSDTNQSPQMTRQQYQKLRASRTGDSGLRSGLESSDRERRIHHLSRRLDKFILVLIVLIVVVYLILVLINF